MTAQPISAFDVEWLVHHQDIVYARDLKSAEAIAKQRVRKQDKLLRVELKKVEEINVPARG